MLSHVGTGGHFKFRTPAILAAFLVLPFVALELVNRPGSFPIPLFVVMWVLGFSFIFIAMSLARAVRQRNTKAAGLPGLASTVMCLIVIGSLWIGLVLDQMPCFLGVPNCD